MKDRPTNKFTNGLNKFFHISERGSSVKTEILGGLVTYLVLCYTVILIPNLLVGAVGESLYQALLIGTIICIVVSTLSMGLYGNLPLALAPGIGIVSYMISLINAGSYTYHQVLALAFIAGALFLIITLTGLRTRLINAIPSIIKACIPIGIGLFIAGIGLNSSNSGILDFLGGNTSTGVVVSACVALFGLITICVLHNYKIKGAIFYGIILATILDVIIKLCLGVNPFATLNGNWLPNFEALGDNIFKLDFAGLFTASGGSVVAKILSTLLITFSFLLVDLFDTFGTLYGAAKKGNLIDDEGNIVNFKRAMIVDSASSSVGTLFGLPTCTIYVESTAGITAGARTGLSATITAIMFALTLFVSPVLQLIPVYATAPAIIFVGIQMFADVVNIQMNDFTDIASAFMTIVLMPLTGNITYGIAGGLIVYTLLKVFQGKFKDVNVFTYIISALFVVYFATQGLI